MDPDRWQQIKGIFQHAVELEPSQQPAYLERACGEDEALRAEIAALIGNHHRAGSFLETPPLGTPEPEGGSLLERSLGAYRVLRQIGQGDMGAVYLAERSDASYRQQVAVKIAPARRALPRSLRRGAIRAPQPGDPPRSQAVEHSGRALQAGGLQPRRRSARGGARHRPLPRGRALGRPGFDPQRLREALEIRRRAFGEIHPEISITLSNLGAVRESLGQVAAAESLYTEALEMWHRLPGQRYSGEAFTLNNLAVWHQSQGHAEQLQRQALDPDVLGLAGALEGLGRALCNGGHPRDALPHLREAIEIRQRELPADDETTAALESRLGRCRAEPSRR